MTLLELIIYSTVCEKKKNDVKERGREEEKEVSASFFVGNLLLITREMEDLPIGRLLTAASRTWLYPWPVQTTLVVLGPPLD